MSEDLRQIKIFVIAAVVLLLAVISGVTSCFMVRTNARLQCIESGEEPLECREAFDL